MRILKVHNYYLQPGGEDTVFHLEANLLRQHGHKVIEYIDDNRRIQKMNQISVAANTVWSWESNKRIKQVIEQEEPDIVHFHNFFPLISPSAYYACREMGVPVVQNLDNQRLICPSANFYRNGKLCLDCFGKTPPWPAILHACYHGSRIHTTVVVGMITAHHWFRTWQNLVDVYVASTNFYKDLFVRAGFPADKIIVKPHFSKVDQESTRPGRSGDYALYIGRLDPEKGVRTLLEAWTKLEFPLKIRGGGQLEQEARGFVQKHKLSNIEFVGQLSEEEVASLIRGARFLVFPSEGYYETFGMVLIECYMRRIPVLASRIGVMMEMVKDGETGLHFTSGDSHDLVEKARWLWDHPQEVEWMGNQALRMYQECFSPESAHQGLMGIYTKARGKVSYV